jgi:hypothetical protein
MFWVTAVVVAAVVTVLHPGTMHSLVASQPLTKPPVLPFPTQSVPGQVMACIITTQKSTAAEKKQLCFKP